MRRFILISFISLSYTYASLSDESIESATLFLQGTYGNSGYREGDSIWGDAYIADFIVKTAGAFSLLNREITDLPTVFQRLKLPESTRTRNIKNIAFTVWNTAFSLPTLDILKKHIRKLRYDGKLIGPSDDELETLIPSPLKNQMDAFTRDKTFYTLALIKTPEDRMRMMNVIGRSYDNLVSPDRKTLPSVIDAMNKVPEPETRDGLVTLISGDASPLVAIERTNIPALIEQLSVMPADQRLDTVQSVVQSGLLMPDRSNSARLIEAIVPLVGRSEKVRTAFFYLGKNRSHTDFHNGADIMKQLIQDNQMVSCIDNAAPITSPDFSNLEMIVELLGGVNETERSDLIRIILESPLLMKNYENAADLLRGIIPISAGIRKAFMHQVNTLSMNADRSDATDILRQYVANDIKMAVLQRSESFLTQNSENVTPIVEQLTLLKETEQEDLIKIVKVNNVLMANRSNAVDFIQNMRLIPSDEWLSVVQRVVYSNEMALDRSNAVQLLMQHQRLFSIKRDRDVDNVSFNKSKKMLEDTIAETSIKKLLETSGTNLCSSNKDNLESLIQAFRDINPYKRKKILEYFSSHRLLNKNRTNAVAVINELKNINDLDIPKLIDLIAGGKTHMITIDHNNTSDLISTLGQLSTHDDRSRLVSILNRPDKSMIKNDQSNAVAVLKAFIGIPSLYWNILADLICDSGLQKTQSVESLVSDMKKISPESWSDWITKKKTFRHIS